jgi:predicted ATPase
MVEKVVIRDNSNTPLHYLKQLKSFKNGKEFLFKEGVNIIVGENGSGKSTLLKLIRKYLLLDDMECSIGEFNSNINALYEGFSDKFLDGVDVYADYRKNSFRLVHSGERSDDESLSSVENFKALISQKQSSTGEGVVIALNSLFNYMFGEKVNLTYDYSRFKRKGHYDKYYEYTQSHKIEGNEFTILMDEPDRNLSLENINHIKGILSFHKPKTQIIAVIHNPLLIYNLSSNKDINFIEMNRGYIKKVKKEVDNLIKK